MSTSLAEIGVGIDVARYHHVVQFVGPDKKPLRPKLIVDESKNGYDKLDNALRRLHQQFPNALFRCVLDDANVYGRNIKAFLEKLPYPLVVSSVNPLTNKRYKQVFLQDNKNDALDAYSVARFAVAEKPQPAPKSDEVSDLLKVLVSRLDSQTQHTTRLINQLHQVLSLAFPEFVTCFPKLKALTARTVLLKWPTAEKLAKANVNELAELKPAPRSKPLGHKRAQKLICAAKNSVATLRGPLAEDLIRDIVNQLDLSMKSEAKLQKAIAKIYREHQPNYLTTIPGVGPFSAAVLTAIIGDIARFPTPEKLVGYFGIYPVDDESGTRKGHKVMSRKGNDLVRRILFMASLVGVRFNPVLRALYARKRSEGKNKMVALGHVMRKLLHLVYAILSKKEPFDPEYATKRSTSTQQQKENEPTEPQPSNKPEGKRSSEGSEIQNTAEPSSEQDAEPTKKYAALDECRGAPVSSKPSLHRQTERTDTQKSPSMA